MEIIFCQRCVSQVLGGVQNIADGWKTLVSSGIKGEVSKEGVGRAFLVCAKFF